VSDDDAGPAELRLPPIYLLLSDNHVPVADIHVNIDDCWQLTNRTLPWEDPNARQIANPVRFPNGMKAVADYVRANFVPHAPAAMRHVYAELPFLSL
jgi:hypothetical protein